MFFAYKNNGTKLTPYPGRLLQLFRVESSEKKNYPTDDVLRCYLNLKTTLKRLYV